MKGIRDSFNVPWGIGNDYTVHNRRWSVLDILHKAMSDHPLKDDIDFLYHPYDHPYLNERVIQICEYIDVGVYRSKI